MESEWTNGASLEDLPEITNSPLYIYQRSNIICLSQQHNVIDVLAMYPSLNDTVVKLPAQYCIDCKKLFISEEEYNLERRLLKHKFIPARMQYVDKHGYYSYTDNPFVQKRTQKSPLMLSGYSVRQEDAIPKSIRQDVLRFVIERGILEKYEVINYLELFINTNGIKRGMEYAVQKWKDDLHFVYLYDFNIQAKAYVTRIQPYRRR